MRKDLKLLVWLTQLGFSIVFPLVGFTLLGLWLHSRFGWGNWVVIAGLVLGLISGLRGLVDSIRVMERTAKTPKDPPPVSFNDHE